MTVATFIRLGVLKKALIPIAAFVCLIFVIAWIESKDKQGLTMKAKEVIHTPAPDSKTTNSIIMVTVAGTTTAATMEEEDDNAEYHSIGSESSGDTRNEGMDQQDEKNPNHVASERQAEFDDIKGDLQKAEHTDEAQENINPYQVSDKHDRQPFLHDTHSLDESRPVQFTQKTNGQPNNQQQSRTDSRLQARQYLQQQQDFFPMEQETFSGVSNKQQIFSSKAVDDNDSEDIFDLNALVAHAFKSVDISETEQINEKKRKPQNPVEEMHGLDDHEERRLVPVNYIPPIASGVHEQGENIQVDPARLETLGIPRRTFPELNAHSVMEFVFATGSPGYYFEHSIDTVAGIQKYFPQYEIFYYDLGLNSSQRAQVRTWCNVQLRRLDFSKYPEHVKDLKTTAFKALIINELSWTHKAVLWVDPHFRTLHGNWTRVFDLILKNGGLYMFKSTGISGYVTTHPQLYKYFPTDVEQYKTVPDYWSGGMYIFNSEKIYWNFSYWWFICSLNYDCIAPTKTSDCGKLDIFIDRNNPAKTSWAGCHKFSQSVIGILINNLYGYRSLQFTHFDDRVATVIRKATWEHNIKYCGR